MSGLKERRIDRGLTQRQIAERIGTTREFINSVERDPHRYLSKPETIQKYAEAIGMGVDDVYAAVGRIPPDIARNIERMTGSNLRLLRRLMMHLEQQEEG